MSRHPRVIVYPEKIRISELFTIDDREKLKKHFNLAYLHNAGSGNDDWRLTFIDLPDDYILNSNDYFVAEGGQFDFIDNTPLLGRKVRIIKQPLTIISLYVIGKEGPIVRILKNTLGYRYSVAHKDFGIPYDGDLKVFTFREDEIEVIE